MRVLHVLHTSLPYVCGYSLRSDRILSLQRQMGIEIAVATSAQQPDDRPDETIDDIRYFRTRCDRPGRTPIREWRLMNSLRKTVEAACLQFKPDIVHAHSPVLVGLPAYRVARKLHLPFAYEVRDLWENASVDRGKFAAGSVPYKIARGLETWVLRRTNVVMAIGEALRDELEPRAGSPVTIIPNGVDTELFQPLQARSEWRQHWNPEGRKIIAYLGAFQPYEGLDVLVKAMKILASTLPDARLLIVGDGPERAALEILAQREGVSDRIRFTGRIPHDRVSEIYAVADLLVYPRIDTLTTRLTTPLKPLEALAMEKAAMASDLPAIRELITDNVSGLLFKAGDPADLARKAELLLNDPALRARLGAAGRQQALRERKWSDAVARYEPVYRRLLNAGGAG
jgi:PEP-CTERM/exosortase A-associated glycosyltransferase